MLKYSVEVTACFLVECVKCGLCGQDFYKEVIVEVQVVYQSFEVICCAVNAVM